jgi:hypothetical protein
MPQGKDWDLFLNNPDNKIELIQFLVNHYKSDPVRSKLEIPLTLTEEEKTWLVVKRTGIQELGQCNHTEADTRLVLHASRCDGPVIVRAADTDIMILLCHAFPICKPQHDWLMKVDHRYVSISKVVEHFGDEVCKVLPAYHSITGCDTTWPLRYWQGEAHEKDGTEKQVRPSLPTWSVK